MYFYRGRLCLFYTLNSKFGNEIADDGFIVGIGAPYQLVPRNIRQPLIASIFARNKTGEDFIYIGDVDSVVYHDKNRNKMLWG